MQDVASFIQDNWLSIALGLLVFLVAGTLILRSGKTKDMKLDCGIYKWSTINEIPVGCYEYFKIDRK